jgi:hypothetical protein
MIIKEFKNNLYHTYSDLEFKIKKVGTEEIYDDAWDLIEVAYEETDIPIVEDNFLELLEKKLITQEQYDELKDGE